MSVEWDDPRLPIVERVQRRILDAAGHRDVTVAESQRHGPLNRTSWHGYLTVENHADVAERLRRMLDGKRYTFVSAHEGRLRPDVRVSQKLTDPMRLEARDDWAHMWFADGNYVWGISTDAVTQADAHQGVEHDQVYLSFAHDYRGERVTIEQFNGYGERMHWTVMVEDGAE